jgi:hypothetical protein
LLELNALVRDIVDTAAESADPEDIRSLLRADAAIEAVRARAAAIQHVLGFWQIRLGQHNGRFVRLHFWDGTAPQVEDVHSHAWPFRSYVLAGRIDDRRFQVRDDPGAQGELARVDYAHAGLTRRVPLGRKVSCDEVVASVVTAAESYQLAKEEFHCSAVRSRLAATLLVTGRESASPYVVQFGETAERDYPLEHADPPAVSRWLEYLQGLLK